jgi:hypothetical protein
MFFLKGVSCDEVFMDVSAVVSDITEAKNLAENIKQKILCETGCTGTSSVLYKSLLEYMWLYFFMPSVNRCRLEHVSGSVCNQVCQA